MLRSTVRRFARAADPEELQATGEPALKSCVSGLLRLRVLHAD